MMVPPPTALNHSEMFADNSNNHFGGEEEEREMICSYL
jgi:hypothetical protein